MTRFDEVARLRELEKKAMPAPWTIKTPEHNDGYQETWIVGPGETGVMPIFDDEDDHLNVAMRNAAPWLLEAAACFHHGDVRCLKAIMGIMRAATGPETDSDELDCLRRLQKAAEIMGGQE